MTMTNGPAVGSVARLGRHAQVLGLLLRHARGGLVDRSRLSDDLAKIDDTPSASDDKDAVAFVDDLESLGPTFVKLGQLLASRSDLLPAEHLEALKRLENQVEPVEFGEIEPVITEELDLPVRDVFESFDTEPVAAGSLAQVHRARLGNGRLVAVKVQRPGITETIRTDLRVLDDLAGALDGATDAGHRFGFGDFIDSFRTSLIAELDFRVEADNLHTFAELLRDYELLSVPVPTDRLVTRRVLTMSWVEGRKITDVGPLAQQDHDGRTLAEQLTRAYIDQILVHGLVHADPHPGNVFLHEGGLTLIDLGMVARLGHRIRRHLLDLTLAIAEQRSDDAARALREAGTPLGGFDPIALEARLAELIGRHANVQVAQVSTGQILLRVSHACVEAELRPPGELAMVGRALSHLDEITEHLDPAFQPARVILRHASDLLAKHAQASATPLRAARAAIDATRMIESLPRHTERILGDLADGKFRLSVDAVDEDEFLRGLEKIATRLTAGIVVAAMLVGAALAMNVDSDVRLLGGPAVAVVFFILAAIGGLGLLAHVFLVDRRDRRRRRRTD